MTDNLRALIGAVQLAHMPDDYQRDMGECPCGFKYQKWSELASHVADAVIATLQLGKETGCGCLPVGSGCNCSYRHCTTWSPCGTVDV